jgi:hypothetical protein
MSALQRSSRLSRRLGAAFGTAMVTLGELVAVAVAVVMLALTGATARCAQQHRHTSIAGHRVEQAACSPTDLRDRTSSDAESLRRSTSSSVPAPRCRLPSGFRGTAQTTEPTAPLAGLLSKPSLRTASSVSWAPEEKGTSGSDRPTAAKRSVSGSRRYGGRPAPIPLAVWMQVSATHGQETWDRHVRDSPLWSAVRRRICRPGIARSHECRAGATCSRRTDPDTRSFRERVSPRLPGRTC